jgi:hypothetical protein
MPHPISSMTCRGRALQHEAARYERQGLLVEPQGFTEAQRELALQTAGRWLALAICRRTNVPRIARHKRGGVLHEFPGSEVCGGFH